MSCGRYFIIHVLSSLSTTHFTKIKVMIVLLTYNGSLKKPPLKVLKAHLGFRYCPTCVDGISHPCIKFNIVLFNLSVEPLFTKWYDVLPPNLVKSRSCEIGCCNAHIALNFDGHLGSTDTDMPVEFQSGWKSLNPNPTASRLHESCGKTSPA